MCATAIQLHQLGIDALWHFTPKGNVSSILRYGLLSLRTLDLLHKKPFHASNQLSIELDRYKGLDRYVHLCLFPTHPMFYSCRRRRDDLVWIEVSLDILTKEEIVFSPNIANAHNATFHDLDELIDTIDFRKRADSTLDIRRVEILVPNHVPKEYLRVVEKPSEKYEIVAKIFF